MFVFSSIEFDILISVTWHRAREVFFHELYPILGESLFLLAVYTDSSSIGFTDKFFEKLKLETTFTENYKLFFFLRKIIEKIYNFKRSKL